MNKHQNERLLNMHISECSKDLSSVAGILRPYLDVSSNIIPMFLLKKVWDEHNGKASDAKALQTLQKFTNELHVANPFEDDTLFLKCYKAIINGYTWQELLHLYDGKRNGVFFFSKALLPVFEQHISASTKSVLITNADSWLLHIEEFVKSHQQLNITLAYSTLDAKIFLEELLSDCPNVTLIRTDINSLEYDFNKKFDLILSIPVLGMKASPAVVGNYKLICSESEFAATIKYARILTDNGKLSIVLPPRFTFVTSSSFVKFRKTLISEFNILELCDLPSDVYSFTHIKSNLLVLTTGVTSNVIFSKYEAKLANRHEIESLIKSSVSNLSLEKLVSLEDWNLDRIFSAQDSEWSNYENSSQNKVTLSSVAEVFRGKAITSKISKGNIGVINISNIREDGIAYEELFHFEDEERKISNYLLQTGDIILPARGTVIRAAIFKEQSYPVIASSNIIVIRPDKSKLDATYLKIFFESSIGKKLINSMQQGFGVMNISYRDFRSMSIPMPTLKQQKQIAQTYNDAFLAYRAALKNATDTWYSTLASLQDEILGFDS